MDWKELVLGIVVTITLSHVLMLMLSKRTVSFGFRRACLASETGQSQSASTLSVELHKGTTPRYPFPYISLLLHFEFRPWKQKASLIGYRSARRKSTPIQSVLRFREMVCAKLRTDHQLETHLSYMRSIQNWSQPYHTLCLMKAFGARPLVLFFDSGKEV